MAVKNVAPRGPANEASNGVAEAKNHATSGHDAYPLYTRGDVGLHCTPDDAWIVFDGAVYDVTAFLGAHPGGAGVIEEHLGDDVSEVMRDNAVHSHSDSAFAILSKYRIGVLFGEEKKSVDEFPVSERVKCADKLIKIERGMVFQVHRLRELYDEWVHSPIDADLRMFDHGFFEFFSRTPWYLIPLVYLPIVVVCLKYALSVLALPIVAAAFAAGVLVWTAIEYSLHRFVFHLDPPADSPICLTFHFVMHGVHHKAPMDRGRLVFPPVVGLLIAAGFYAVFAAGLPAFLAEAIFSGGLFGYVCYDCFHYYTHHGQPFSAYMREMKSYHMAHHYKDRNAGFGITSKLWDIPFKTTFKRSQCE